MGFRLDNTGDTGATGASFKDNVFEVVDFADSTKTVKFDVTGTTGTTLTLVTQQTANTSLTFPDTAGVADTFVLTTLAQTVTAKTLTNSTIGISNVVTLRDDRFTLQDDGDTTKQAVFQLSNLTTATTRTLSIPDLSGVIALTTGTQTLQSKTLDNSNIVTLRDDRFTLQDDGDTTKQAVFQLSGITTATTRTLTVPDLSGTIALTTGVQTIQNKVIDNSNTVTFRDDRFTLQDDADTTKQAVFQLSGITTGTTRTYTLPNQSGTLAISPLTTKGDLWTFSTVDARLAVGTDGQVLSADSTQATGLKWITNSSQILSLMATWSGSLTATHDADVKFTTAGITASVNRDWTVASDKFTATRSGYYLVIWSPTMEVAVDAATNRQYIAKIYRNGSFYQRSGYIMALASNSVNSGGTGSGATNYIPEPEVSAVLSMNGTTDYFECYAYQANGSGFNRTYTKGNLYAIYLGT